jgi:hypothetical protein
MKEPGKRGEMLIFAGGSMSSLAVTCFVILTSVMMGGCSSTAELSSSWNNNQIVVDGQADDWGGHFFYLKDSHVSLGLRNDQDYLYVCLMSSEGQFRRQMMGLGLTVWLEPQDGKKWGIHYPIGFVSQGGRPSFDREETGGERDTAQVFGQALQNLEILGPGNDEHQQFSAMEVPGISVKVGDSQGSVVYELRVPLRQSSDHPYAVGTGVGSTVKLALETGKFEGRRRQSEMGEGGPEGGGGGRGGGGRGGFGGRGRGGGGMWGGGRGGGGGRGTASGERPEPLDFSAEVHLASTPAK